MQTHSSPSFNIGLPELTGSAVDFATPISKSLNAREGDLEIARHESLEAAQSKKKINRTLRDPGQSRLNRERQPSRRDSGRTSYGPLKVADLSLDAKQPTVSCAADSTKNAKRAKQYIQKELASELKAYVRDKRKGEVVFAMPHETSVAKMLVADLEVARAKWMKDEKIADDDAGDFLATVNSESHRIDFHCLRHTLGAWLVLEGHPVNVVQKIMRHSTVVLTLETYGHLYPNTEADAVRTLHMTKPQAL